MESGEPITVKIEKLLSGGNGLAREGGRAVFVPGVIPGETVRAEIVRVRKDYAEARLVTVIDPSPYRRNAPCPLFSECGGCDLQHIDDAMQLPYKLEAFREVLARIARLRDIPLSAPIVSEDSLGYRFRVLLKVQGPMVGFFRRGSHQLVPVRHCPISHPLINRALPPLADLVARGEWPNLREIQLQVSERPEQVLLTLFLAQLEPHGAEAVYRRLKESLPVVGLVLRAGKASHVLGQDFVTLPLMGESIRLSDRSFVQAHWHLNERVVPWALDALEIQREDRVLELYAGVGNFTVSFARRAKSVVAVEGGRSAVRDAKWNLRNAGLENVQILHGPAEWAAQRLQGHFDRIFIDPPRSGAGPAVLQVLPKDPKRMVYLSCAPATLARDLRFLIDRGWRLLSLQPFDMFPQTAHLEVGATLQKDR